MEILTPFQIQLLKAISESPIRESFYLTGGTALSAFFLQHRYSEDLDFFTPDPNGIALIAPALQELAQNMNFSLQFTRTFGSFLECFISGKNEEQVKMDFAYDTPYRLQPTALNSTYNIYIDNKVDIACNKLSALFDRAEPKDFVDVYFICHEYLPFDELKQLAQQKHVGMDEYWLAVAFQRVQQIAFLPRMIKPVTIHELQTFFLNIAKELMSGIE
ncbi:MAG: nucleotidyl transferase AbiEii/AbiGii toxin family protein [Candidatus Promineifilaceae bacterium]